MTALSAFDLLMVCVRARRMHPDYLAADRDFVRASAGNVTHFNSLAEKNAALEAVIVELSGEIRRILTPGPGDGERDKEGT